MPDAKWYVVHTYSGYENKVMSTLITTVENRGLQDMILDVKQEIGAYMDRYGIKNIEDIVGTLELN